MVETGIKIYESQKKINDFSDMKKLIHDSVGENVRFLIETKHIYGWGLDPSIGKRKNDLDFDKETISALLDYAISIEQEKIKKAIELEIELNEHKQKLAEDGEKEWKYCTF